MTVVNAGRRFDSDLGNNLHGATAQPLSQNPSGTV
jgi:hypothetical protein